MGQVRLAEFILENKERILKQWEAFAAVQLPAASHMTPLALRDHAEQILEAISKDLETPQTRQAQREKSKGLAHVRFDAPETAAQTHAILRAKSGFNIVQLAAEYRALRASVLRLWTDNRAPDTSELYDLIRFNEAIDQALAESIAFFSAKTDESRNLLLGMLGHDMRTPLQTIQMTATYLSALNIGDSVSAAASRLINSGARIRALLDDLVDFNRTRLGLGIRVSPQVVDLSTAFSDELKLLRSAYPLRQLNFEISGNCQGVWDGMRLRQLLDNLVQNAFKYGAPDSPVLVSVDGNDTAIVFEVTNNGSPIEHSVLEHLFDPLTRGLEQDKNPDAGNGLGLGLFISREIVNAHGGEIKVRSDQGQTVFTVRIPHRTPSQVGTQTPTQPLSAHV